MRIDLAFFLQNDQEQAAYYVSSLIKTNKNSQNSENYCFPTPQNPGSPDEHAHSNPEKVTTGTTGLTGPRDP